MTRHPDVDVLAECREGLLGRRRSARVRAHVAGCSQCAAAEAGLAEVSRLLAAAPTPAMPGQLAARLENVLAAEAAARAEHQGAAGTQDGTAAGAAREDRRAERRERRPRQWRTAVLGAAAALAVIIAVGGSYGLARLLHQGGTAGRSASGAGAPGPEHAFATGPTAGPAEVQPLPQLRVISSGTDYQPGALASQAAAVLARQTAANGTSSLEPGGPDKPAGTAAPPVTARLRACVTLVTGGIRPQFVDVASYRGRPATIIVQAPSGGQPGQVWVAGPACSASQRDLIAHTTLATAG